MPSIVSQPSHNWKTASNPTAALQAMKQLFHFHNIEKEVKLQTELKVFHTSYLCPPSANVSSILSVVKESNAHLIFPNMTELLKAYNTSDVHDNCGMFLLKAEAGENLCTEERLSELLQLAIEKDIPINHNDAIDISKDMANRKLLL